MIAKLNIVLVLISSLFASPLLAKGLFLDGTFQAPDPNHSGRNLEVKFVLVETAGTTTRIAGCNFDWGCDHGVTKTAPCSNDQSKTCSFLDNVLYTEDYTREGKWIVNFMDVFENGRLGSMFTVKGESEDQPVLITIPNLGELTFKK